MGTNIWKKWCQSCENWLICFNKWYRISCVCSKNASNVSKYQAFHLRYSALVCRNRHTCISYAAIIQFHFNIWKFIKKSSEKRKKRERKQLIIYQPDNRNANEPIGFYTFFSVVELNCIRVRCLFFYLYSIDIEIACGRKSLVFGIC